MCAFRILMLLFMACVVCVAAPNNASKFTQVSKEGVIDLTMKNAGGKAFDNGNKGFLKDYSNFELGRMGYKMYVGTLLITNGDHIKEKREYDSDGCPTGIWQNYTIGAKKDETQYHQYIALGDYVTKETIYKDGKIHKRNDYTYDNLKGVLQSQQIYDISFKATKKEYFDSSSNFQNMRFRHCKYEPEYGQMMINREFYTNGYVQKESEIVKKSNGKFVLYKRFYNENGKLYKEGECPIETLKNAYYECQGDNRFTYKDVNDGRVSIRVEPPKDIAYKIEPYKEMQSDNKTIKVEGYHLIIPLKTMKGESKIDVKTKREYNQNGKLTKETIYDDYGNDIGYKEFAPNGKIESEEINGVRKTYYESGQLRTEYIDGVLKEYYNDGKLYRLKLKDYKGMMQQYKYARDGNIYYCFEFGKCEFGTEMGEDFGKKPLDEKVELKAKENNATIYYTCDIKVSDKKMGEYGDYIVESVKCISTAKNEYILKNGIQFYTSYTCDTSKAKENDKTHSHCYKEEESAFLGNYKFEAMYDKSGNLTYIYAMENKDATSKNLNDRARYLDSINNDKNGVDVVERKFSNNVMILDSIHHCSKDKGCKLKSSKTYTENGKPKEEYNRQQDTITKIKYAEDGNIYYKLEYVVGLEQGYYGGEPKEYVKDVKYFYGPDNIDTTCAFYLLDFKPFPPDTKEITIIEPTFKKKEGDYDDCGYPYIYKISQNTYKCNVEIESKSSESNDDSNDESNKDSNKTIVKSIQCQKTGSETFKSPFIDDENE